MLKVFLNLLFFLLFPLISKGIMRTDLSFLNVPIRDGIMLTTIEETISNVLVNGTQDLSLVKSETELVFNYELGTVSESKIITFDLFLLRQV